MASLRIEGEKVDLRRGWFVSEDHEEKQFILTFASVRFCHTSGYTWTSDWKYTLVGPHFFKRL